MNKKPKARENVLDPKERARLLKAIDGIEEELAVKGILYTGMRVSEYIHFHRNWIDRDENIIHVPYSMKCNCYECMAKKGKHKGKFVVKTRHAERPIPIVKEVERLFKVYFDDYEMIMDLLDNRIKTWNLIKKVGERAKIGHKVFPHALRATYATILCEKGLTNPVTLKDIMGWKGIDMATHYIKLSGAGMKKEIDKIW